MCGVCKFGLELSRTCRLEDLIVDEAEFAFIQLDLVVLAEGNHRQWPFGHFFQDFWPLQLRKREDQGDWLDLPHHNEAVWVGRMDDVADIDLSHTSDPPDRRGQPRITQLHAG